MALKQASLHNLLFLGNTHDRLIDKQNLSMMSVLDMTGLPNLRISVAN